MEDLGTKFAIRYLDELGERMVAAGNYIRGLIELQPRPLDLLQYNELRNVEKLYRDRAFELSKLINNFLNISNPYNYDIE